MGDAKPLLVLDFDGVLHSYASGWHGAANIPDPPVPGALRFLAPAAEHFRIAIFSSRSHQEGGLEAMQAWLQRVIGESPHMPLRQAMDLYNSIEWPTTKPPAFVTLDDRAITFTGKWPEIAELLAFRPWNLRPAP